MRDEACPDDLRSRRTRVSSAVNREQERHRKDSRGNIVQEVRGQYASEFTEVGSNKHFYVDTSGESRGQYATVSYVNGDHLFAATGNSSFGLPGATQKTTGLVEPVNGRYFGAAIMVTSGPFARSTARRPTI